LAKPRARRRVAHDAATWCAANACNRHEYIANGRTDGAQLTPPSTATAAAASTSGIIQADPATNSIIINAPDAIYNNLRAAVDKLDVRRAQVYVEALIAEVTAEKAAEFGVQWQALDG